MFNRRLISFTQLFACLFLYCVAIRGGKQGERDKGLTTGGTEIISDHHGRVRRSSRKRQTPRYSCAAKFQCTGNKTLFETIHHHNCYCDNACFEIFFDCCPDYQKYCGRQDPEKTVNINPPSMWKCVKLGLNRGLCLLSGPTGVWMIQKCPRNWPFNETRAKCETPRLSRSVLNSIPVVGENEITYRNRHCAVCHGVNNYSTWSIRVFTFVIPPESLDLDSKLQFIVQNGGRIDHVEPRVDQPRRYCAGNKYISNCTNREHTDYNDCINGPVEVVSTGSSFYKNQACGSCNGIPGLTRWGTGAVCGLVPEGFSLVFNVREPGAHPTTTVVSKFCPDGTVFDTNLEFCRKGFVVSPESKLSSEFLIVLWFEKFSIKANLNSTLADSLKSALTSNFSLLANQISTIQFHNQDEKNVYIVATFRLTLTPFQTLILADQNKSNINLTRENTAFLKLLNTSEAFTIFWQGYTFSVIKLTAKQLSCYQGRKFQPNEYEFHNKTARLFVKKTGEEFSLRGYTLLKENGGNITLCRHLVLSDCNDGAYVPLTPSEYVTFPNLTVYHNATNSFFNFGEYLIRESLDQGVRNISNTTQNSVPLRNSTISVCLPFKDTFNKTELAYTSTSEGLRILTFIGFTISIICLIFLLTTYGLFKELRTVPGMNLMSLSFSMLLSHLLWLIGTAHFKGTKVCEVFAILEHYLFQVSFLAMSVISYHTCRVFTQPFAEKIHNTDYRKFIRYSAFVWFTPAIFVAVCITLDKTEVLLVYYGRNCWLGTTNAKLYLFLLPIAIILLYNIYTFIKTAITLFRHEKQRRILQRQERRQNLLICTKLATLVGFPWLFSFFGVLFPDEEAFEYLFVVFVCLQGLYIGIAFLFNKKTLKLYKERWTGRRKISIGSTRNVPTSPTFEMT